MDVVNKILGEIKFDKEGIVVGQYYGICPLCKKKRNLIFNKENKWVCRKCYYGK